MTDAHAPGWVLVAGAVLLILGILSLIEGVAAFTGAHVLVAASAGGRARPDPWGWAVMWVGLVQIIVGCEVIVRRQVTRWTSVVALSLTVIPAALIHLDVAVSTLSTGILVMAVALGLLVHDRESPEPDRAINGCQRVSHRGTSVGDRARPLLGRRADRIEPTDSKPVSAQRLTWRRSAQNARRAWNEWSAAEPRARDGLYQLYADAAAAEERAAAELELTVHLATEARRPTSTSGQDGPSASAHHLEPTKPDA